MSLPGKCERSRDVIGKDKFLQYAVSSELPFKDCKTVQDVCAIWSKHIRELSEPIPEREKNAIKIITDIMQRGCLVICMEFGHVNHARDFAHSHLEMLIPLDMVPTYEKELETHGELQVYFIDAAKEIKLRTEEHYLNTQQASTRMERERKLTFIAQSEDYFNFTGIVYPLDEVNALPSPLKDCVASEYVCVRITFIEASPETRIDFLLGPVLGIVKKK